MFQACHDDVSEPHATLTKLKNMLWKLVDDRLGNLLDNPGPSPNIRFAAKSGYQLKSILAEKLQNRRKSATSNN